MGNDELTLLNEICNQVKQTHELSDGQQMMLTRMFGNRFKNAQEALREVAVKKYVFEPSSKIVWIVVGKGKDYQILPNANFCSCDDFYYHVIDKTATVCYHIIAQKLSEALGRFEMFTEADHMYEVLMEEWRFIKKNFPRY